MLLAKGNISEYNEMMGMSVEDFLIRFKIYIQEIEQIQEQNAKAKK
jgi:hypothetical protein